MYQFTLIAAFVAGMVALFAPCCVTYLLPAYFGNIFRERKRVLLMTLVYSLGIMVVMLPVVLGARMLSGLFFRLHDQTYLIGGGFLLLVAVMAFLGVKLPMIGLQQKKHEADIGSTFILGVISGITSSCCAPVLIGVLTLSSLSPTLVQSLLVGVVYVLGMVTPLYFASWFVEAGQFLKKPIFRKSLGELKIGKKIYPLLVSNVVAGTIFALTGIAMIYLTLTGGLGMEVAEAETTKAIYAVAEKVTKMTAGVRILDGVFLVAVGWGVYKLIKKAVKL